MSNNKMTITPEEYEPSTNSNGDYVDYSPSDYLLRNGIICPCTGHPFYTKTSLKSHFDTKRHRAYICNLNENKNNYLKLYKEANKKKNEQKLIIAKLELELQQKNTIINHLEKNLFETKTQLETKQTSNDDINDSSDEMDVCY